MIKTIAQGLIVPLMVCCISFSHQANAQVNSGCLVQQASQAALQRRLAEIDATKTNVDAFFSGPSSCVNPDLFSKIDLSTVIPDLSGFLNNNLSSIAQNILNNAKNQICTIVQSQINNVINKLNSTLGSYQSSIGNEMTAILGQVNQITTPNIPNFGQYNLSSSVTGLSAATQSLSTTPIITPTIVPNTQTVTTPTTTSPGGNGSSALQDVYQ